MRKSIKEWLRDMRDTADAIKLHIDLVNQHNLTEEDLLRLRAVIDAAQRIDTTATGMIFSSYEVDKQQRALEFERFHRAQKAADARIAELESALAAKVAKEEDTNG